MSMWITMKKMCNLRPLLDLFVDGENTIPMLMCVYMVYSFVTFSTAKFISFRLVALYQPSGCPIDEFVAINHSVRIEKYDTYQHACKSNVPWCTVIFSWGIVHFQWTRA